MSDMPAVTASISAAAIQSLAAGLQGDLILPNSKDYDQARRTWNGMIDRRPALIVRCQTVIDVILSVNFAREHGLLLAVRGGGHNVAGHATCDGGLVLDLAPIKRIEIDVQARLARAGAGVVWGELDAATQAYGLATPGGVFSLTGIAGLTLGGGYGWLRNKFGLSCDNLVAAEVVTASGEVVRASATENSDLLWGLRGGGGNFGVVTQFEYQLHPVGPEVMCAFVFHDGRGKRMNQAIRFYRDFCASAPHEVSTIGFAGIIPPGAEHYPPEIHGFPVFAIGAVYAGSADEGAKILQPVRDFADPLFDASGLMPYVEVQKLFDAEYPDGWRYYWKSLNLSRLDDEVISIIADHARRQPSPFSTIDIWHIGGAVSRGVGRDGAFYGRQAAFLVNPEANWQQPADDAANMAWARDLVDNLRPYSDGSRYLNFPGFQEEGVEMMRSAFGPNYARLAALKQKYDPGNLFRLNQNILP